MVVLELLDNAVGESLVDSGEGEEDSMAAGSNPLPVN